jgi:Gas vesicle protein K
MAGDLVTRGQDGGSVPNIDLDRDNAEHGLVALVLTIVELLRQLMERQAVRRLETGTLTDEQVERMGSALMALDEQMALMREHFGLSPEDLNLDLGPLGSLLPRD